MCYELSQLELDFARQVKLPVVYKGVSLDCGYRMNLIAEDIVVVELKAVERIIPVYAAQLLSYLKLADKPIGLLINFHVAMLKNGLKRIRN